MFATIYLPNFYLQAAVRHQPELADKPLGMIDPQEAKAVLIQVNRAAEEVGVRCGMTPSQGLARSLQLVVKTRSRQQEQALEDLLLQLGFSLAPYVEATAPGICTVQFTDSRSVRRNVERVIEQLRELNITAQGGIAKTPETSFLAAYLARPILQVNSTTEFLAPLPIETLAIGLTRY